MEKPGADWVVDVETVTALLKAQQPEFLAEPPRYLASGWDNVLFEAWNGAQRALVRLPRRQVAVPLLENEQRWLPTLPPLPVPIPAPFYRGRPLPGRFDGPWSLSPFFEGEVAYGQGAFDEFEVAVQLGRFLATLAVPAPESAPRNPYRSIPLRARDALIDDALATLDGQGWSRDSDAVRHRWFALRAAPSPWDAPDFAPVWLHGDLHPGNLLVHQGRLSAVIDWGDMCAGDRAADLSIGWMLFDERSRAHFWQAAQADAPTVERARGWALARGLVFLATAQTDPAFGAMAERTLARCLD